MSLKRTAESPFSTLTDQSTLWLEECPRLWSPQVISYLIFRQQLKSREGHLQNSLLKRRQRHPKNVRHFERKSKTKRFCHDWTEKGRYLNLHEHRFVQSCWPLSFEKTLNRYHFEGNRWRFMGEENDPNPHRMRTNMHQRVLEKCQESKRQEHHWTCLFCLLWRKDEEGMYWRWIQIRWDSFQEGLGKWQIRCQGWHVKHWKTLVQGLREKRLMNKSDFNWCCIVAI